VIPPKLYRRYANWSARKKAKVTSRNFQKFLGEGSSGKPDTCYETGDFLANGAHSATPRNFKEFVEGGQTIKFQHEGLVFGEAPSMLVGADGKVIGSRRTTGLALVRWVQPEALFTEPLQQFLPVAFAAP
jgi:hypothetical protein